MNLKMSKSNSMYVVFISIYAFMINWISGNLGVMPIDTFAFFDTGYSTLNGKYPIRDFWIFQGLLVDYLQAGFFFVFGSNWTAYIIHGSFFNILISVVAFFTFINLNLSKPYSFLYALSIATLCYPVSGTPFAYQHSFVLSLISIFVICVAIKKQSNILFFILPIIMLLSFLAQQTPSSYINLVLIAFIIYHFISEKNLNNFKFFILGSLLSASSFFIFLIITKTPFKDFIYQYILFPLTIGEARISNDSSAYTRLIDQINFKRLVGNFKFIHLFFVMIIFTILKDIFSKSKKIKKSSITICILILISTLLFIFHQLITANQIFIFALIPILAGFLHINLIDQDKKNYVKILIIIVIAFSTIKYHYRFNLDRKFMDLEKVNLEIALPASELSPRLKNLKWITPLDYSKNPKEEFVFLKKVIDLLKKDKRNKTIITHYQFFSLILDEDLNILNRWYLDHNTHPTKNHKYFNYYKDFVNKNLANNNVEVIYLVSFTEKEMTFDNIKVYFTEKCFKNNFLIENKLSYHEIINCNYKK